MAIFLTGYARTSITSQVIANQPKLRLHVRQAYRRQIQLFGPILHHLQRSRIGGAVIAAPLAIIQAN